MKRIYKAINEGLNTLLMDFGNDKILKSEKVETSDSFKNMNVGDYLYNDGEFDHPHFNIDKNGDKIGICIGHNSKSGKPYIALCRHNNKYLIKNFGCDFLHYPEYSFPLKQQYEYKHNPNLYVKILYNTTNNPKLLDLSGIALTLQLCKYCENGILAPISLYNWCYIPTIKDYEDIDHDDLQNIIPICFDSNTNSNLVNLLITSTILETYLSNIVTTSFVNNEYNKYSYILYFIDPYYKNTSNKWTTTYTEY